MAAILFDFGGTHIRSAIADNCDCISTDQLRFLSKIPTHSIRRHDTPSQSLDEFLKLVCRYVVDVSPHVPSHSPVIIAFAGPIDSTGKVVSASMIVGDNQKFPDIQAILARMTGRSVHLLNDMSAATWYLSKLTDAQRFMAVTISSGIGSKIFDRASGQGVIDQPPYAGEIGHISVSDEEEAPICDCGVRGHLQAFCSGRGIEREGRRQSKITPEEFEKSLCVKKFNASQQWLTNEDHLIPAAREGDPWALNIVKRCIEPLGRILAIVTIGAGLDRVMIIGGLAQSLGSVYVEILATVMQRYNSFATFPFGIQFIEGCNTNSEISLLGAATFAHARLGIP
jgi:glucokinase